MRFVFYKQLNEMDCGPTCLRMISKHYGRHYNPDTLRQKAGFGKQGVSLLGISETAEDIGFRTRGVQVSYAKLKLAPLPAILHWDQNHFVVLLSLGERKATIADPRKGVFSYSRQEFEQHWCSNQKKNLGKVGTALLMEPAATFYQAEGEPERALNWNLMFKYLLQSRWRLFQIFISLFIGLLLQLLLPFLTQSLVDIGINTRNMQYITIVLIAQLMLTFSSTVMSFIRSRLQLRISNVINISILSDFWIKLTRLPVSYFDNHHTGDTIQRIGDNRQVQSFLTGQAISAVFSVLNFTVYSIVLALYGGQIFIAFTIGNILYFAWIRLFLRFRRKINYEMFHISSQENNATLQLVQGMQEIRLNNAERLKRWEWEDLQARVFKLNFRTLNYGQWQATGALLISQGKDIIITFMVAQLVIQGQVSFGTMLAIQFIIGQLSGPVQDFISLTQNLQDVKISMERLNEIHRMEDEEPAGKSFIDTIRDDKSICITQMSFAFPGLANDPVLKNINMRIEEGKVTAIVGVSGSGKTTLLKLLLKIYDQYQGEIAAGEHNFRLIKPSYWRRQCGAVLQDGYIFNDSIAKNIVVGDQHVDYDKLIQSCRIANILSFIDSLPNGFNTLLGAEGVGVSQGQRQRLLIARAVYKDPQYLFFDEATNALDANNEKVIASHLQQFFKGRTVVIVAHRLSTIINADNIFVLRGGKIVESGTHDYLISLNGHYHELVRNQVNLNG
jgi:ATP-binding cassette subfamily B protein